MATSLAVSHVGECEWSHQTTARGCELLDRVGAEPSDEAPRDNADLWESAIDHLVAMLHLGHDWDGLGAQAPARDLVASAVGLAYLLQERGLEPPTRVVPAPQGRVILEWQEADGTYCEVEVLRPLYAEVMLMQPGKPPLHWSIPDET